MESSTDLCFEGRTIAAECCSAIHTCARDSFCMNTVNKPGKLGADVRCVVVVAMFTEGWHTNTVAHVLGVRSSSTQLLCGQGVGAGSTTPELARCQLQKRARLPNCRRAARVFFLELSHLPNRMVASKSLRMMQILHGPARQVQKAVCRSACVTSCSTDCYQRLLAAAPMFATRRQMAHCKPTTCSFDDAGCELPASSPCAGHGWDQSP
jgi:hypothetical protein